MPPDNSESTDLHVEFCIILSLATLVAAINNEGQPTLAKPYPSDDAGDYDHNHVLVNAVATILERKSRDLAAIICKPLPPANSMLVSEPNPYQFYVLENAEPATCPGSEAELNITGQERCILVEHGQSHMSKIRNESKHWELCLQIPDDDPLENHVATLEEFIQLARQLKNERENRRLLSRRFSEYLATSSFEKMRRRISHWFSQGVIYRLGQVNAEQLKAAVDRSGFGYTATGRRDRELIRAIAEKGDMIKRNIMDHCPVKGMVSELTHLVAKCRHVVAQGARKIEVQLYDETTCFEFHQLVVATLLAYGGALNALYAAQKEDERDLQNEVALARRVWHCATFLWRIAYSGTLRHHLGVLNKRGWFVVPIYDDGAIETFQQFTGFDHHVKRPVVRSDLEQAEDEENEFLCMMEPSVEAVPIFFRWQHIQVDHWEALSILSKYATIADTSIQINPLVVQRPDRDPCSCKVAKWERTVKTLIDEHGPSLINGKRINADAVIECLKSKIVAGRQATRSHSIFHRFSNENLSWGGTVHVQAAMASLVNFIDDMGVQSCCNPSERRSIKGMDRSIIGTSTSYCPTCWELLGILRRKATDFTVHNRHTTLSHVQLPPWVPQDVMMEMLDRFKQILLHQIIAMIEKQVREKHAQSFYQQSGMRGGRPTFDSLYSDGESDNGD